MIFLIFAAQLLSISCIMLHYSQHFQCKKKHCSSPVSSPKSRKLSVNDLKHHARSAAFVRTFKHPKRCCIGCFQSVDGEEFDLFPISFLLYLVFILIISTLVLTKECYLDYYINDRFMRYTLRYIQNENPLIIAVQSGNVVLRTQIHTENYKASTVMDWIICYSLMILSIIESFFNFQRYFVTNYTSNHFFNPQRQTIVKTFSIYAIIYLFLFISHIHFCYWLFPLVIGLHCTFNVYCTWAFCAVLIERYRFFSKVEKGLRSIHEDLLSTVYIIRRASIISALLSSLYVSIFCIVYDVDIVIYIPLLWSASNVSFLFNFVRNRMWMKRTLYLIVNSMKTQDVKPQAIVSAMPSFKHPEIKVTSVGCKQTDVINVQNVQNTDNKETDLSPHTVITAGDNDSTPYTHTISITSNTVTPPFALKTPQNTASPCLLTIPSPITTTNANSKKSETETETPATDENDSEYQKWYSNRKASLTPTTPNIKTHEQQNTSRLSSLRITITDSVVNRTKRKLKLFDILGIDKTPLADDDHKGISLAYDMTPMKDHSVAVDIDEALADISDSGDEPSVQTLPGDNKIKESRTSSGQVFLGILKRAASVLSLHDTSIEAKYPISQLQNRPRSNSDPTAVKHNDNSSILSERPGTDEKYDQHLAQNSLALDIHRISNRSAPGIDGDTYCYKRSRNIMSHSMMLLHGSHGVNKDNDAQIEGNLDIPQFRPNNDALFSVLVSHGFYSRSSVNDAKQLRLYLQDK